MDGLGGQPDSSSAEDLALSGLLQTGLLSLYFPWVVLEQFEVLQSWARVHVEGLQGVCDGWLAGFALA